MKKIFSIPVATSMTILRALLFPLCCALMLIIIWPVAQMLPVFFREVFAGTIAAIGAYLLSLLFLKWEKLKKEDVGLAPGNKTLPRMLTGYFIGLTLVAAHIGLLCATGHVGFARTNEGGGIIIFNLLLYIAFALREEIAYRGFPLQSLARRIAPWKAQLILAAAFAIEHKIGSYTWLQALTGAALGGILFGVAALRTKGLALPLGIHAAWNFGQWIMGFKNTTGAYRLIIEKGYERQMELMGWFSYWLVIGLGIFILSRHKKRNNKTE